LAGQAAGIEEAIQKNFRRPVASFQYQYGRDTLRFFSVSSRRACALPCHRHNLEQNALVARPDNLDFDGLLRHRVFNLKI